jgi:sulfatase maturation enzyme AslB (radical SAM superfamily)
MITRLYLMPTHRCNCACSYCYISESEKKKQGSDGFFKTVIRQYISALNNNGAGTEHPQLRFIGGEPYLKFQLMHELSNVFLAAFSDAMVVVNTNGTLVRTSNIETIDPMHRKKMIHVVSLDGIAEIHNARRKMKDGSNAFVKTVEGIKLLQDREFPVYVNMVLDDISVQRIDEFMIFLKDTLSMHALSVSLLYVPGQTVKTEAEFQLLKKAYEAAGIHGIELGGHHRLLLGDRIPALKCKAGIKTMVITSDGTLTACQRFVGETEHRRKYHTQHDFHVSCTRQTTNGKCYSDETIVHMCISGIPAGTLSG